MIVIVSFRIALQFSAVPISQVNLSGRMNVDWQCFSLGEN